MFDAERRLKLCNRLYAEIFSLPPELTAPGTSLIEILNYRVRTGLVSAADGPDYIRRRLEIADRSEPSTSLLELSGGRTYRVRHLPLEGGGWLSTHEDITEQVRVGDELRRTQEFMNLIIESIPEAILVKDARRRRFTLLNRAAEDFLGMARSDVIGKTAREVYSAASANEVERHDEELLRAGALFLDNHHFQSPGKGERVLALNRKVLRGANEEPLYLLTVIQDVTERRQADERIAHLAHHDPLTDLPNRAAFNGRLESALVRFANAREGFAVLCIDLDRLKEVNDIFGHAAGDQLLCAVSERLTAAAGDAFLARLGGDEFALVSECADQPANAASLSDRLLSALESDLLIDGARIRAGISIGVALFPKDGRDTTTLLANADAALYRAKAEGRGVRRFFEPDMDKRLRDRHAMRHDLQSAIARNELELFYQPQAKVTGRIIGFEALLRWRHPLRGLVPPATFIPVAEESRLIIQIGDWVLREACREAATWPPHLSVAINLSPVQFHHGELPERVHSVLFETGLAANRLELEITEGVLIADAPRALSVLRRLKAFGVRIAMDDFGSGYSSLSYLRSFPFDKIKIDRAFVTNVDQNPQSAAIIRAVLGLARGLELPVLAEGVETEEELDFLAGEQCDQVQGYLIGRPLPIAHYANLVCVPPAQVGITGT